MVVASIAKHLLNQIKPLWALDVSVVTEVTNDAQAGRAVALRDAANYSPV
jgi:hypothetical protein